MYNALYKLLNYYIIIIIIIIIAIEVPDWRGPGTYADVLNDLIQINPLFSTVFDSWLEKVFYTYLSRNDWER